MLAIVVYESMYGNTHVIADHIAEGLSPTFDVRVVAASRADLATTDARLLVVGGPTHVHGVASRRTRSAAIDAAQKDESLHLDEHAVEPGLREWLDSLPRDLDGCAAAFDTRLDSSPVLTGRAAKGIAKRLRRHGFDVVIDPESFLVDSHTELLAGEDERARRWGAGLASLLSSSDPGSDNAGGPAVRN